MYDELVKRLREVAEEVDNDYDVDPYNAEQRCLAILEAADAIEELSRSKDECDACGTKTQIVIESLQKKILRWVPVTERLPDQNSGNLYICLIVGGECDQLSWYELCDFAEGQFWIQEQLHKSHVTHWMPLPEPPKEET